MNLKALIVVANTGESSLSIIDPVLQKEIRRIMLVPGGGSYDLVNCGSDGHVLVTQPYDGTVALVEVGTGKILETLSLGRCPSYIVYDRKRSLAFISNCDSNSISILCVSEMGLTGQIGVGSMPQGMDLDPLGGVLAVANVESKDLWLVDLWDYSIARKVGLEGNPFHIKYSGDGAFLFVSCSAPNNEDNGAIWIMDAKSFKVLGIIGVKGIPGRLYNTFDGQYLLVTSLGRGGIEIFETRTGRSIKKIPTNGMTHGILSDPKERYIYVTNTDDNTVSKIDLALGVKVGDIEVGNEPNGIIML